MRNFKFFLAAILVLGWLLTPAFSQEDKLYTDPIEHFEFQLPANWQAVDQAEANGGRKLEFVFRGHGDDGQFRIRKGELEKKSLDDFMKTDELATIRYLPGFIAVKHEEPFGGGSLEGKMIEFTFKRYNSPAEGRYYYLTDGKGTVWKLEFSGRPNFIRGLRPETDRMARSFKPATK